MVGRGVVRIIGFAKGDRKLDREPGFPNGTGSQLQCNVKARQSSAKIRQNFARIASSREGQGISAFGPGSFSIKGRTHVFSHLHRRLSSACMALLCAIAFIVGSSGNASAQTQFVLGTWSLVWEGAKDNYTGTMRVTSGKSEKLFDGKLNLIKSDGSKITEDATLTVTGNEVRIECANPSVKGWNPDRFYVEHKGGRLEGYSLDTAGQRGKRIVFNKH